MKCEHCGKNEVSFVYQSNINGQVEAIRLCQGCAEELGYLQKITAHNQRMMQNFFSRDGLFGNSLWGDFFTPSFMGRREWLLDDPFEDFFTKMPALGTAEQEKKQEKPLVEEKEQSRFSRMRELNALRMEMKKAIRQENFERAAELRDQIRMLESRPESTGGSHGETRQS